MYVLLHIHPDINVFVLLFVYILGVLSQMDPSKLAARAGRLPERKPADFTPQEGLERKTEE